MRYNKLTVILGLISLLQLSGHAKQVTDIQTVTSNKVTKSSTLQQHISSKPMVLDQTTIKTIDGEVIHVDRTKDSLIFKGYEDKIVLLEAFGHSCPPCKAAIPGYNRLQKKYYKDVVVIAIEVWGSDNTGLRQYANTLGIHYKAVAKVNSGKMVSFIGKLTGWNPGMGVPYLILLSRGGTIAKDVPPQRLPESHVESLIQELL